MATAVLLIFIVLSAVFHEYAHGWVADRLGDPTARHAGRLTMNPLVHLDLFGSIILPLVMWLGSLAFSGFSVILAYAKPVPYNPYNLKDLRWGPAWVGIAGPASNILIAVILAAVARFAPVSEGIQAILGIGILANTILAIFNMVPIPPLDGSKLLFAVLPDQYAAFKNLLERNGMIILLLFIFFGFKIIQPIIFSLFLWLAGPNVALSALNLF